MATANYQDGLNPNHDDEEPNHIILWLDTNIGNPKEYRHLKKAFGSNTDPRESVPTQLRRRDYENLLRESEAQPVLFEGIYFLLQVFNDKNQCLKAYKQHSIDKKVFLITSGRLGKEIVPEIFNYNPDASIDKITQEPCSSIYVFCQNVKEHLEWAINYINVEIFDFDSTLLQRLLRDIATYFINRAERLRSDPNRKKQTLQRLYWAKRLWHQYDKMDQNIPADSFQEVRESSKMKEINRLIQQIDPNPPQETYYYEYANRSNENDDENIAVESEN